LRAGFEIVGRVSRGLRRVRGVRRAAVAFGLGALGALAFEPFRLFPLLLFSYAGLVLLFDGAAQSRNRIRAAAWIGWCYGFGFFLLGLYWIGYAFLVDAAEHAWELPFAAVLLPGGLALFFAGAGALCLVRWPKGYQRVFLFAVVFALAGWLRGHVLTGFPWNLPAYGWGASPALLQSVSVFGVYGLSLLTLLWGASFAAWGDARGRLLPLALSVFFVALWGNGEARLLTASDAVVPGVRLRLVQPDTPQSEKYAPQFLARNWRRLVDLSAARGTVSPTHIIWPEAAPPFVLARAPAALDEIARLTGTSKVLMTGEVRVAPSVGGAPPRFYNSFAMFGAHGKLLAESDKFHLVPFGEYLPLENILRAIGLTEIAADTGFSAGDGPKTFAVPGAPPVTPLICYEIIFPGEVTGTPRPQWLVNMTDDSWFGPNSGPMQHLLIARARAIEEGLPVARAANSGISALIDPYGRVRASLALGLRGVVDADLPVALPTTPFARFGNSILLLLFLACAGAALWPLTSSET
jgi:apolipoprotein N-acyltransferase